MQKVELGVPIDARRKNHFRIFRGYLGPYPQDVSPHLQVHCDRRIAYNNDLGKEQIEFTRTVKPEVAHTPLYKNPQHPAISMLFWPMC